MDAHSLGASIFLPIQTAYQGEKLTSAEVNVLGFPIPPAA